jgi:alpha-N-arabinofuranosidase
MGSCDQRIQWNFALPSAMPSQQTSQMRNKITTGLSALAFAAAPASEYHVAPGGNDSNAGTQPAPFRTIQHAAELAQPGDVITVHEGVYRERINPPRGGESDARRITYQAAPGEKVTITGSEPVTNWVNVQDDIWKVTLPNSFFGTFNPYTDLIHGDWFGPKGREHHTGAVYLNGDWLDEAAKLDDVLQTSGTNAKGLHALWFGKVDKGNTTIWAQFKGVNPNKQSVEINARQSVFYPDKEGCNYITVRGFTLCNAATPWAPPTAEQIGLIGTHWSKGWIIENNTISYSRCSGVSLGKYGDEWDNKAGSATGYVGTIQRALKNGWNKETVGGHLVRNNEISHCEQAGIVGSLGAVFSTITGNTIHDIHVRQLFTGAEMAGIKFHGAIDVEISHNHIYRTCRGTWLDWMAQGTHLTGNLYHDNSNDLFTEVDHGPILVDNNLFLSAACLQSNSQGAAYVHNLFAGAVIEMRFDGRMTPFLKPHSTEVAALHENPTGDHRFYNNLFAGRGDLSSFDKATLSMWVDGNVFFKGAKSCKFEEAPQLNPDSDPVFKLVAKKDGIYLEAMLDKSWAGERTRKLITTELLGKTAISDVPFEQPDSSPLKVDADYFGRKRNEANPTPGPFENPGTGPLSMKVW